LGQIISSHIISRREVKSTMEWVAVQFHDAADEIPNHQGHEGSQRLLASDNSFVYLGGLGG
jgi:hypothetical protein